MPRDPLPPPLCPLCGGDLANPAPLCDHAPAIRQDARWILHEEKLQQRLRAVLRERQAGSVLLLLALLGLWLSVEGSPLLLPLPLWLRAAVLSLLVGGALVCFRNARHAGTRVHFIVEAPPGLASGEATMDRDALVLATGRSVVLAAVAPGFPASSSAVLRSSHRNPSAYLLLRAALLSLVSSGALQLRIARELTWSRTPLGFPRVHARALRLLFHPGSAPSALPWLERQLLLAAEDACEVASSGAAPVAAGPYRSAEGAPSSPPRWVSLGELLRAFHRPQGAQPFHRKWFQLRVSSGAPGASVEERIPGELTEQRSSPRLARSRRGSTSLRLRMFAGSLSRLGPSMSFLSICPDCLSPLSC